MQKILLRLIIDIGIAYAVLNGWWFIVLPLSFVGIWIFPFFIEIVIAGLIYDSLFGFVPEMGLWGYVGTLVSILFLSVITWVKGSIR
ncbi:MAG: hypothetical protein AB197_00050 [Parcubacteria bacterium C7867-002]|nr:MAG: hypothetical protein AB197_00050 [Parcubacteria bacterium C7867-002]